MTIAAAGTLNAATYTVTDSADSGTGTLRQAILDANSNAGPDSIEFDAAITAVALSSALPMITEQLSIDGTVNHSAGTYVEIDGATNSVTGSGLHTSAAGCEIYGVYVHGFSNYGILLDAGSDNAVVGAPSKGNVVSGNTFDGISIIASGATIEDNYIGTDTTGLLDFGNSNSGILVSSSAASGTVRGNVISGNNGSGIYCSGDNIGIYGNTIGLGTDGNTPVGNGWVGVLIDSVADSVVVGSAALADRNVVSNNGGDGVGVLGTNATVEGNYIGTDSTGLLARGNASQGIFIGSAVASGTMHGNVISGNDGLGIFCNGDNIGIYGNTIGLGSDGDTVVGNGNLGILIESVADSVVVGSAALADRNVVSGNGSSGVSVLGTNTMVVGNYIGTDSTGMLARPNDPDGVNVGTAATDTLISGNVLSGNVRFGIISEGPALAFNGNMAFSNGLSGVWLQGNGSGSVLQNNSIHSNGPYGLVSFVGNLTVVDNDVYNSDIFGVVMSGSGNLLSGGSIHDNAGEGIFLQCSNSTVSGCAVYNNGRGGVIIAESGSYIGNSITENSIYDNGGMAIGPGWWGPFSNDTLDGDSGANNHQNFPELDAVHIGDTELTGVLPSEANTTYRLDFYRNDGCNGIGWGEAREWLGNISVTTDSTGNAPFTFTLPATATGVDAYTATATDPSSNTSCISYCALAQVDPQPDLTTIARDPGSMNPAYPPTNVDFNLTFDKPISNLSPEDLTVTQTGIVTSPTITKFTYPWGDALHLARTDSFSNTTPTLDLSNRSFTIEFWANRTAPVTATSDYPIAYGASLAANQYIHIGWADGYAFRFGFYSNDLDTAVEWGLSDEWSHWACTFDDATKNRRIYRNGELLAEDTASSSITAPGPLYIGANGVGDFDGKLDEVRVWGEARSQADIQNNMFTPVVGSEMNLLALYRLEGLEDLGVSSDGADDLADSVAGAHPLDQTAGTAAFVNSTVFATSITATVSVGGGEGELGLEPVGAGTGHDITYFGMSTSSPASETFQIITNDAPTDITLDNSSVPAGSGSGATVGVLSATDPDNPLAGQTFTFSLVAGAGDTDNSSFAIVGDELRTASALSITGTLSIRVQVTDDGIPTASYEKPLSITVSSNVAEWLILE